MIEVFHQTQAVHQPRERGQYRLHPASLLLPFSSPLPPASQRAQASRTFPTVRALTDPQEGLFKKEYFVPLTSLFSVKLDRDTSRD